jgi:predicted dehydrogenase
VTILDRIAAAPISWGVCEVPGWGAQMAPMRVLGEMRQLSIHATEAGPDGYLGADPDAAAGIAVDMAVHEIDQIRRLLGREFLDVTATGAADGDDPDVAVAIGRLSGGAVAAITLGRRFPPGDSCWLELFGSAGYVREPFMSSHEDFLSAPVTGQ